MGQMRETNSCTTSMSNPVSSNAFPQCSVNSFKHVMGSLGSTPPESDLPGETLAVQISSKPASSDECGPVAERL
eukprot:408786-Pyramimonas_sp.AAC.1